MSGIEAGLALDHDAEGHDGELAVCVMCELLFDDRRASCKRGRAGGVSPRVAAGFNQLCRYRFRPCSLASKACSAALGALHSDAICAEIACGSGVARVHVV